ncbi:MAG: hypothetical protein FWB78_07395 [Treponema sp.]|nr:hypothetical protein [Treponema sp.]
MKKRNLRWSILALGLFVATTLAITSCGRDAIFFTISMEVPPQPPRIRGGPTQMVVFNWGTESEPKPVLFVASGSLFWYSPEPESPNPNMQEAGVGNGTTVLGGVNASWGRDIGISQPPGRVIDIAATQRYLYALTGGGINNTLYRTNSNNDNWERVGSGNIQSIFADGERLFAGIRTGSSGTTAIYGISSVSDDEATLDPLDSLTIPNTRLLTGAVSDGASSFILSTNGGVFRSDGSTLTHLSNADADPGYGEQPPFTEIIVGMIRLPNNSIIAVGRGGFLHNVTGNSIERIRSGEDVTGEWMSTGRPATSALAIWEGNIDGADGGKVLAVGVQGSLTAATFNNGYVEFLLDENGALDIDEPRREANNLASVQGEHGQYRGSLGRLPLNHLFQAPWEIDEYMTFFASTQTAGLWSFRTLDGVPQWNAEN